MSLSIAIKYTAFRFFCSLQLCLQLSRARLKTGILQVTGPQNCCSRAPCTGQSSLLYIICVQGVRLWDQNASEIGVPVAELPQRSVRYQRVALDGDHLAICMNGSYRCGGVIGLCRDSRIHTWSLGRELMYRCETRPVIRLPQRDVVPKFINFDAPPRTWSSAGCRLCFKLDCFNRCLGT